MDFYEARKELRRMGRRRLLRLVSAQKISGCLIGGRACGLYLHYKGFNFCVSEIMGQGCQVERAARLEEVYQGEEEISCRLLLMDRGRVSFLPSRKKTVEFKVYCRDHITRSMIFLGKILERRTKERGDNLRDLLIKATKDFSCHVPDPFMIFLLGS